MSKWIHNKFMNFMFLNHFNVLILNETIWSFIMNILYSIQCSILSELSYSISKFTNYNILVTSNCNHKRLGLYYLIFSMAAIITGAIMSVIIRLELYNTGTMLMVTNNESIYNVSITLHGLIMIFFVWWVIMPNLFAGLGNYLLVIYSNCIEVVYPRMNNLSLLILYLSYILVLIALLTEYAIGVGWTLYPPLSSTSNSLFINIILIALGINGISSTLTSINFILLMTITTSYNLYSVCITVTAIMLLMVLSVLNSVILLLLSDINLNTSYFSLEGDSLLFQHLFWYFGHPEVYILIIPGFGIINIVLSKYSVKSIFGYISIILAINCILVLGNIVWSHHMFVVGLEVESKLYFSLITLLIAIPTGTKIYSWLCLFLGSFNASAGVVCLTKMGKIGSPSVTNGLNVLSVAYVMQSVLNESTVYLSLAFVNLFLIGGLTGIVLGNNILDISLHDTYYVVAHFHYVLSLGTLITVIIGAIVILRYLGYNIILDSIYSNLVLFNLNLIFLPLFFLGFNTLPRRIYDYGVNLNGWNSLATTGLLVLLVLIGLF